MHPAAKLSDARRGRLPFVGVALLAMGLWVGGPAPCSADQGSNDGGSSDDASDDKDKDGIDDALDTDDDNDGTSDTDELAAGTDPRDANSKPGGSADFDGDGIKDDVDADDDNDGFSDTNEVALGTNPRNAGSHPGDSSDADGDGLPDTVDNDDDNDGVSDTLETDIGTDPRNPASTPFGTAPASGTQVLDVRTMSIKLDFVPRDTISLSGTVPIAGTSLAGKRVIVSVGGVSTSFTLNAQGSGKNGASSVRLGKPQGGVSAYTIKLAKGQFARQLSDEGLSDEDGSKSVDVGVALLLDNTVYEVTKSEQYVGKKGKSGIAR